MNYPCLIFTKASLLPTKKEDQYFKIKKTDGENLYILNLAGTPANRVSYILDSNGCLYVVHYKKFYNSWLSKISTIFDFVKAECIFEKKENLTVKEIKKIFNDWYKDADHHFGASKYFMKSLDGYSDSDLFDANLFKSIFFG